MIPLSQTETDHSEEVKLFDDWFYSVAHRQKYDRDNPAYLGAREAWFQVQADLKLAEAEISRQVQKKEKWKYKFEEGELLSADLVIAIACLIKSKGRFHTEKNYIALVAAYDAYFKYTLDADNA